MARRKVSFCSMGGARKLRKKSEDLARDDGRFLDFFYEAFRLRDQIQIIIETLKSYFFRMSTPAVERHFTNFFGLPGDSITRSEIWLWLTMRRIQPHFFFILLIDSLDFKIHFFDKISKSILFQNSKFRKQKKNENQSQIQK